MCYCPALKLWMVHIHTTTHINICIHVCIPYLCQVMSLWWPGTTHSFSFRKGTTCFLQNLPHIPVLFAHIFFSWVTSYHLLWIPDFFAYTRTLLKVGHDLYVSHSTSHFSVQTLYDSSEVQTQLISPSSLKHLLLSSETAHSTCSLTITLTAFSQSPSLVCPHLRAEVS